MRKVISPVLYFGILIGFWQLASDLRIVSPAAVASPAEILIGIWKFFSPNHFLLDTLSTVVRAIVASAASLILGVSVGVFIIKQPIFRSENILIIDFFRSIPATALVPLFLVFFGVGDLSKIAAGVYSGGLVVALSTVIGFRQLNEDRKVVADLLQVRGWDRLWHYEIREAWPSILVGLRAAVSLSLILVIVSEMFIGSDRGLGRVIMDMRYTDRLDLLYGAIIVSGLIGYLFNQVVDWADASD